MMKKSQSQPIEKMTTVQESLLIVMKEQATSDITVSNTTREVSNDITLLVMISRTSSLSLVNLQPIVTLISYTNNLSIIHLHNTVLSQIDCLLYNSQYHSRFENVNIEQVL